MSGREATRLIWCAAALGIGAAAIFPTVAEASVVEPVWITKSVAASPSQPKSITLKCPTRAAALNGAAPNAASSTPRAGARRWSFRFTRPGSATLRCVRLRLPHNVAGVDIAVGTTYEPIFQLPPGFTQQIDVRCPTGQVPTGWGLDRTGESNGLEIVGAEPVAKGWSFAVKNTGPTPAAGNLAARCLARKQRARTGQHHTFSTRVASFTQRLAGSATTTKTCRASEYSVATGVSPTAGDVTLAGTGLTGQRGASWTFSGASGSTSVQTSLICLAKTTGFHR